MTLAAMTLTSCGTKKKIADLEELKSNNKNQI